MKAIYKGHKFSIVWNIINRSTQQPFDFTGLNVSVGLYSDSCRTSLQSYNIENGTITAEIEANSLPTGVYNLICRYANENEQAYCIYRNAFQITLRNCIGTDAETVTITSAASHIDSSSEDDMSKECQLIAEELFGGKFKLPQLTADRAIADEHGNRISDTYVTRRSVEDHIKQIYNQQFIENPPLITEGYITPEMLSEETREMLEATGQSITNLPDGEDLQAVHGVLKLANKKYNPNSFSGLGRQYLRKNIVAGVNILTQSMIQWTNTIYIIQYDYDLQGKEITIPAGCVLDFQGGSFNNGLIAFDNTIILNNAKFNCDFSGHIANRINLKWFGVRSDNPSFDNSVIINKIASLFDNIYLPNGQYYYKNKIKIKGVKAIEFDGYLIYNGNLENTSTIEVTANESRIKFNQIIGNIPDTDTEDSQKNLIGINFVNCNGCDVSISFIYKFNNNCRISGIGEGCSYNHFNIMNSICSDEHIRVYQENGEDGSIGWANQNYFTGNRITNWSTFKRASTAINIRGGENDSYDHCNSLTFDRFSIENLKLTNPIKLHNARNCRFINLRNEGNHSKYFLVSGRCLGNWFDINYSGNNMSMVEYDKDANYPGLMMKEMEYNTIIDDLVFNHFNKVDRNDNYHSDIFYSIKSAETPNKVYRPNSYSPIAIIVPITSYNIYKINTNYVGRFYIKYYDSEWNIIQGESPISTTSMSYSSEGYWITGADSNTCQFYIHNITDAKYLAIGFRCATANNDDFKVSIKSYLPVVPLTNRLKTVGTKDEIPNNPYLGFVYYNTSDNTQMVWTGKQWIKDSSFTIYNNILKKDIKQINDNSGYYFSEKLISCSKNHKMINPGTYTPIGILFKYEKHTIFKFYASEPSRCCVKYFDTDMNPIEGTKPSALVAMNYNSNWNMWNNGADVTSEVVTIDENEEIGYIFVGILGASLDAYLLIMTNNYVLPDVELCDINGPTENRPANCWKSFQYYDTTINKPIWWNGDKWVDATGAEV